MLKKQIANNQSRARLAPWAALALFTAPMVANAQSFSFKLEPGVPIPLSAPQSSLFDTGGGQSLKALFGLSPFIDIGPSATVLVLPDADRATEPGIVWGFGGGLRVKRPHDKSPSGISPWFDADALFIRTGDLNRPGFDAAIGLSMPVGKERAFWVGPFVRYLQVIEPQRDGFDDRDAKLLTLGLSFEVGSGLKREPVEERIVYRDVPGKDITITKEVAFCADRDGDSLGDNIDRCPDAAGAGDNWGCPKYAKVVILPDKLKLKEKIMFAWDEATLDTTSYALLDEVVQALKDNKGFRVEIGGHADSSGGSEHNQTLSEKRAETVLNYLTSHGIAKSRLVSKGFGETEPTKTNTTVAGREENRRVEFTVYFILVETGATK
jgi:outer membrane protein OmpA-like peptidoglycan-associated protein